MVTDVAVVGGGPAGIGAAMALAGQGVRVALYEQTSSPRLKPCGEGLLPHGVAALQDLVGALPPAPRIRGLRFVVGSTSIEADFPSGEGLIVRRDRFDGWLLARAGAMSNIDVRIGARYRPAGERMVVGADGKRSMFHRRLAAFPSKRPRVGLSTHVGGIEGLGDRVEVFFHDAGEVYLAQTAPGEAVVSALFHRRSFRRDGIAYLLGEIPELRRRTARAEFTAPVLACSPLAIHVPRVIAPGLLLIGDAAGAPDPIAGEGMALALTSAVPAAHAIVSGRLDEYARFRGQAGRTARHLAALLLTLARVQRRAAHLLVRRPAFVSTLLDVAVSRRPLDPMTVVRALI